MSNYLSCEVNNNEIMSYFSIKFGVSNALNIAHTIEGMTPVVPTHISRLN